MNALPSPQKIAEIMGGHASGSSVVVPGPGHSTKDRSLSITIDPAAPDGFVVHSFAGDDPLACKDHVREKLGLPRWEPSPSDDTISRMTERVRKSVAPFNDLDFNHARPQRASQEPKVVAEYVYQLTDGSPSYKALRYEPKGFSQMRWNGQGWDWGGPKGAKVPYRLPDMLKAVHDVVFVVEGEKDADNLAAAGFVATCNIGGAEKWTTDLNAYFKNKTVFILPDNDEAGARHAQQVLENLRPFAASLKVVELPALPPKGDVSDWIAAGGNVSKLVEMCETAPPYEGTWKESPGSEDNTSEDKPSGGQELPTGANRIAATPFVWRDPKEIPNRKFLYGDHLIRRFGAAKFAAGGVGKSALALVEAIAMATNRPLLGVAPRQRCRIWYWNGEDPREEIERRIAAICLHYKVNPDELSGWLFYDSGRELEIVLARQTRDGAVIAEPVVEAVISAILVNKIDVMSIDPFVSSHRVTENDNGAIDMVAKKWTAIADKTNSAIELIHHTKKTGGAEATVEDGRGAVALLNAVRSAQVLNKMTEGEAQKAGVENHRLYFKVENGKANLAPPPEGKNWFRIASVDLGNGEPGALLDKGDNVGVVIAWKWPDPLDGVTGADFDAAAAEIRGGRWRENSQAKDWVGWPIAKTLGLDLHGNKANKAKVAGIIKAWVEKGSLVVVEELDEKRMPRKYVQVTNAD